MNMIDKVAIAIWECQRPAGAPDFESLDMGDQNQVKNIAIALIEEMKEPTDEMVEAGVSAVSSGNINLIWEAMIEAALEE